MVKEKLNERPGSMQVYVPMGEVVQTDWSIEEAMSFVMTGGTNSPDSILFTAGDEGERR